jgi:hypothetical protein
MSDLSTTPRLRLMASTEHLHEECLINSGPFKVDGTPDILIVDFDIRGFFGLGIHHKLFLTPL